MKFRTVLNTYKRTYFWEWVGVEVPQERAVTEVKHVGLRAGYKDEEESASVAFTTEIPNNVEAYLSSNCQKNIDRLQI